MPSVTAGVFDGGATFNAITLGIAVGALLATVVGVVYARRSTQPPLRRLRISLLDQGRVVDDTEDMLQVTFNGTPVPDVRVVHMAVTNTGREPITSEMFDRRRPILMELGAPILVIKRTHDVFQFVDGAPSRVLIGPELLQRNQTLHATIYLNGQLNASLMEHHIVGATVDTGLSYGPETSDTRNMPLWIATFLAGMTLMMVLSNWIQ